MPRSFAPAAPARTNLQVPAPGAPVPMDVDRTRTRHLPPAVCYNCGLPGHVAKACTTPRVRQTDLLQEIIAQLGPDMCQELVAHLEDSAAVAAAADEATATEEDFTPSNE